MKRHRHFTLYLKSFRFSPSAGFREMYRCSCAMREKWEFAPRQFSRSTFLGVRQEFIDVHAGVADDLAHQPAPEILSRMHGHDRRPPVGVTKEHVTPLLSNDAESKRFEGPKHATRGQRRQPCHPSYLNRLHADEFNSFRDGLPWTDIGPDCLVDPLPKL